MPTGVYKHKKHQGFQPGNQYRFKKGNTIGLKTRIKKGERIGKGIQFLKGHIPWNKNKKNIYSKKTLEKMSKAHRGSKNYFWMGGISGNPYPVGWTKTLKRSIRERDHYTCQICGRLQNDKAFDVHHIDYDKDNLDPGNLVTLCRSCHLKTNFDRKYWIEYFRR